MKKLKSEECPFCCFKKPLLENKYAVVVYDNFPVNKGHVLIVPRRHYSDYFASTAKEIAAFNKLLTNAKAILDKKFSPDGYNIGINCGKAAGQTVMHMHIHLIPRYKNDVKDPRGGVRGVIPNRQKYKSGKS